MRILPALLLGLLLAAQVGRAEPFVAGFERFHAAQPTAAGGRLLYNELGCANCHTGETGLPARRGPALADITRRVQPDWLRAFLANPVAVRAGTAMPHSLPGDEPEAVEAVVHYLATLKSKATPRARLIRHVNAGRGRELFHTIGCVACHAPASDYAPPEGAPAPGDFTHRSVAFPQLAEKYTLSTLADFLRDPLKTRPDGRMPRIEMDVQDATDLAGHLLDHRGSDGTLAPPIEPLTPDPPLVERGRALVAAARCAACHDLPKNVAAPTVPLNRTDGGCLSDSAQPGVPRYKLSAAQRAALKQFLAPRSPSVTPAQLATLTLEALNCTACHDRDGRGGPDAARQAFFHGDHNLGDTGRYPPPLTGVGRKLQSEWLAKSLTGEARERPYLKTQMPIYGDATAGLAALLSEVDAKPETPLPAGEVEAGRKLLGTLGGNSCITCHRWGERESLGIHALDLSNLAQRLQPGWLREYLIDPAAYRAGTLMPSFWPEGTAANPEVLGGDTARQIASIYAFAAQGEGFPEGFPDTAAGEFELIPTDHPIVQRAFIEGVGTHAILVGFPQNVHLAYDGRRARPALAWQGRFFDAYTTWFSRFVPFEQPLGAAVVKWPEPSTGDPEIRFEGYRLDSQRVPTFLLTIDGVRVEERFEAVEHGLRRAVNWDAAKLKSLPIAHPEAVTVTEETGSAPGQRRFIYLWK